MMELDKALDSFTDFTKRIKYTETTAWAIPSKEAINKISRFVGSETLLEIGAGLGYWAKLLQDKGVKVIPTDSMETDWKHNTNTPYTKVIYKKHTQAIESFPEATVLFLCWPPYNEPMAEESLKLFKGDKLVYIGESYGGCNATDAFFNLLEEEWIEIEEIRLKQWWGIHDYLWLYQKRNKTI